MMNTFPSSEVRVEGRVQRVQGPWEEESMNEELKMNDM